MAEVAASAPRRVGPYLLVEEIGRGADGVVYRARHADTGEAVALKSVRVPQPALLQSIRREVHALARLRHPGIVRIAAEGVDAETPWYAMELVEGPCLDQYVRCVWDPQPKTAPFGQSRSGPKPRLGRRTLREILGVLRRLCSPLAYLHGEGIVHRDLKPHNVLVRSAGRPVLVDFGLICRFSAEPSREALDLDHGVAGTYAYMAPEQMRGELVDARADLYSLGAILHVLLTGRPPFRTPAEVMAPGVAPAPPSDLISGVPAELDALALGLLAKQPRERIGHADDVASVLEALGAPGAGESPRPRAYLYRPALTGRKAELRWLEEHLDRLEAGRGGLVLLAGESGIGKTRLALELAREAGCRGLRVLAGESSGLGAEATAPLRPLRPLLQALVERAGPEPGIQERGHAERKTPVLALLALDLARASDPRAQEAGGEEGRQRLFRELLEGLAELSDARAPLRTEAAPALLILDDLQWADELTLGFLEFLERGGHLESLPLLVLALYRDDEFGALGLSAGPLQALLESPRAHRPELAGLDGGALGAMAGDMLALPPPSALLRGLADRCDGNPFFAAEYLRAAVEEGMLYRDAAGRWQLDARLAAGSGPEPWPLPRSVRDVVSRRLAALSPSACRLLDAACVLGRDPDALLLPGVTGLQPMELMESLDALLRRQVLEETAEGRLRFVHDQIREVAYERLDEGRRRGLHRAAAEAIERRPAPGSGAAAHDAALLGRHWERAAEPLRARPYHLAAARQAASRFAHAEAVGLYRTYLRLSAALSAEDVTARRELAAELRAQGRPLEALEELRRAVAEAEGLDASALAGALLQLGRVCWELGRIEEARALYERALALAREHHDRRIEARAVHNLAGLEYSQGRLTQAHAFGLQAAALHREVGDLRLEAIALGNLALICQEQSRYETSGQLYEQALAIARELGDRQHEGVHLSNLAILRQRQGDAEAALELYGQAHEIFRETGHRRSEGKNLGNLALLHLEQGRPELAAPLHEQALAIHREVGDRQNEGITLGNLGDVHHHAGRLEEARALYEQSLALAGELGDRRSLGLRLCYAAMLERRAGQLDAAERGLTEAEALLREVGDGAGIGLALCERGHLELAHRRRAREPLSQADELASRLGIAPQSELGRALARLRRAVGAAQAGDPLLHGELSQDLPAGLRHRLGAAPAGGPQVSDASGRERRERTRGKRAR
jgi:predicted ATPase/tRNA A-37 threonylcarbamoyl transferase component Bud32